MSFERYLGGENTFDSCFVSNSPWIFFLSNNTLRNKSGYELQIIHSAGSLHCQGVQPFQLTSFLPFWAFTSWCARSITNEPSSGQSQGFQKLRETQKLSGATEMQSHFTDTRTGYWEPLVRRRRERRLAFCGSSAWSIQTHDPKYYCSSSCSFTNYIYLFWWNSSAP